MAYSWAKPNARVVCVKAIDAGGDPYEMPVVGKTYTIREVEAGECFMALGIPFIRLREIRNPPHHLDGIEPSFAASYFQPVVDGSQFEEADRSLFQRIADSVPHEPTVVEASLLS